MQPECLDGTELSFVFDQPIQKSPRRRNLLEPILQAWHWTTLHLSLSAELSVCGRMSDLYYGCVR